MARVFYNPQTGRKAVIKTGARGLKFKDSLVIAVESDGGLVYANSKDTHIDPKMAKRFPELVEPAITQRAFMMADQTAATIAAKPPTSPKGKKFYVRVQSGSDLIAYRVVSVPGKSEAEEKKPTASKNRGGSNQTERKKEPRPNPESTTPVSDPFSPPNVAQRIVKNGKGTDLNRAIEKSQEIEEPTNLNNLPGREVTTSFPEVIAFEVELPMRKQPKAVQEAYRSPGFRLDRPTRETTLAQLIIYKSRVSYSKAA